jgi:hypothetical protein
MKFQAIFVATGLLLALSAHQTLALTNPDQGTSPKMKSRLVDSPFFHPVFFPVWPCFSRSRFFLLSSK